MSNNKYIFSILKRPESWGPVEEYVLHTLSGINENLGNAVSDYTRALRVYNKLNEYNSRVESGIWPLDETYATVYDVLYKLINKEILVETGLNVNTNYLKEVKTIIFQKLREGIRFWHGQIDTMVLSELNDSIKFKNFEMVKSLAKSIDSWHDTSKFSIDVDGEDVQVSILSINTHPEYTTVVRDMRGNVYEVEPGVIKTI
jgi:hypothetical protein